MFGKKAIEEVKTNQRIFESEVKRELKELKKSIQALRWQLGKLAKGDAIRSRKTIDEGRLFDEITSRELQEHLQTDPDALIVDVRSQHEWHEGHIPTALHIQMDTLERSLEKINDKAKRVHLICASGGRSLTAAKLLAKKGYEDVVNVSGGMKCYPGEITHP